MRHCHIAGNVNEFHICTQRYVSKLLRVFFLCFVPFDGRCDNDGSCFYSSLAQLCCKFMCCLLFVSSFVCFYFLLVNSTEQMASDVVVKRKLPASRKSLKFDSSANQ